MPDSTNPTDVAFLKECQDLMALIDHTERLLRRPQPARLSQHGSVGGNAAK